jgi:hypothetical protein
MEIQHDRAMQGSALCVCCIANRSSSTYYVHASVHATNRTCMCRHASTDATHLTWKHIMTCKHVEI